MQAQQKEECTENYKKSCFINYDQIAFNTTVQICRFEPWLLNNMVYHYENSIVDIMYSAMFPLLNSSKHLFTSDELQFRNKNCEYYMSLWWEGRTDLPNQIYHRIIYLSGVYERSISGVLSSYEYCVLRTPLVKDCGRDRKRVGRGKSVALGGRRIVKTKYLSLVYYPSMSTVYPGPRW